MSSTKQHPSPLITANAFSRFFFSWISPLITKSHEQGTLHLSDLYELPSDMDAALLTDRLEANWFAELKRSPNDASLIRATARTVGWKLLLFGLLLIPLEILNIVQPLLLRLLIKYFEPCSTMSAWEAWLLASGVLVSLLVSKLLFHQYVYRVSIHALRMRLAYNGLIFRKILRLSSSAMSHSSSGEITNLIANDSNKVEYLHHFINYLWVAPLQIIAVVFLLWHFVKYIALIPIGYTLFLLMIQPLLSRMFIRLRSGVLKITDERVKMMSEIIKSMRIVKMYCWETALQQRINQIRKREVIQTARYIMCNCLDGILSHTYISVAFLMTYGTMWSLDMPFDAGFFAICFVILSYTRQSSITSFNYAVRDIVNYMAAEKRIRKLLFLDESERDKRLLSTSSGNTLPEKNSNDQPMTQDPTLSCSIKQAYWDKTSTFMLKSIYLDAQPGDLICIIGPVGSGKSSLLQALSGEIAHFNGHIRLRGSLCFVPQESWIFSSSVKENILFGKDFNHKLFQRVTHVTALDTDFEQLSHGANTLVGDQGVMLSGGQKARVNMARALYRDADIYLLDDPLSAVDTKVSKHLFDKSIKGYLGDKICILVTHQVQFLQEATKILVLDHGEMTSMGTYEELLDSSPTFAQLLEDIHQHEQEQKSNALLTQQSMIGSINSEKDDGEETNAAPTNTETKQQGTVQWHVYVAYLRAGAGLVLGSALVLVIFSSQQLASVYSNWWLAVWSDDETLRHQNETSCNDKQDEKMLRIQLMNDREWKAHRDQRFYTFAVLLLIFFLLVCLKVVVSRLICLNAGRVLHNQMFKRVIRSPISFFDMNPVGRILNRFTSDVAALDDTLSTVISDFLVCLSQVLGTIALVGLINPWAFLPAFVSVLGMLLVRYRFAPCSRDLKRLVGPTRSPIYSQLTSTIHGLKVIRSYRAEAISSNEFVSHLNDNARVDYLIITLNRWSAFRFDLVSLLFISLVTAFAIVARTLRQQISAADIALTMSYSLNMMGLFQWTIRQSVEVETQMTSVERVLEYCALDQEPPARLPPPHQPPPHWPISGRITFHHVSMSHSDHSSALLALHDISIVIRPTEKIGIVGRTGAGKSSFIQTLFRLGTLVHGQIIIDDVDIATIGLDDLRRRLSVIPQDPVLFTGTIRSNLDQFGDYSDVEIWHALEQVQLKRLVSQVMSDGLQSWVSESGSNLSVGQKQLMCLARAILKKSRILVIDEATANVDNATDELIQRSIREQFRDCTVLTVAHRLRTVIDSDRIMVLDRGELVECGAGDVLLSERRSHLSALVEQTGSAEAAYLRALARTRQAYQERPNGNENGVEEYSEDWQETEHLVQ